MKFEVGRWQIEGWKARALAAEALLVELKPAASPTGAADRTYSGPTPLMQLIEILSVTYTDGGVAIWLSAPNKHLNSATPLQFIQAGDMARVIEVARRIEGAH